MVPTYKEGRRWNGQTINFEASSGSYMHIDVDKVVSASESYIDHDVLRGGGGGGGKKIMSQ